MHSTLLLFSFYWDSSKRYNCRVRNILQLHFIENGYSQRGNNIDWRRSIQPMCSTLLGMTIPSTINSIALDAFVGSNLLRNVSISLASNLTPEIFEQSFPTLSSMGISIDMIMHRFDELPLHKYCYDSYPTHDIQPPCRVPCRCWSLYWGGYQTCVNVPVV